MAIYHLTARTGSRTGGQSALAHATYIERAGKYERAGDRVVHVQSGNLPAWTDGQTRAYWEAADLYERANGRLYQEVEYALPVELDEVERLALARELAEHLTAKEQLPYEMAIHAGYGHNPHVHLMISERRNDGIERTREQWFRRWNGKAPERGGAQKSAEVQTPEWLRETRETWEKFANRALERAGHAERIDHRSLADQGVNRVPQTHMGAAVLRMEDRGMETNRGDRAVTIARTNAEIVQLASYRAALDAELARALVAPEEPSVERPAEARAVGGLSDSRFWRFIASSHSRVPEQGGIVMGTRSPDGPTSPALRGVGNEVAGIPRVLDRTAIAVERELGAMGGDAFEVGILERSSGRMMNRTWSAEETLERLSWLKRMNAQGNDIFVRPVALETGPRLVLVDDLVRSDLQTMKRRGWDPAVIVETSPENFQAWVKLENASAAQHRAIAQRLASELGGDPNSAAERHYGRLAGFTNRKPEYENTRGLQPFVLLREWSGRVASAGSALVDWARGVVEGERRRAEARDAKLGRILDADVGSARDPGAQYAREMQQLLRAAQRFHGTDPRGVDLSRADFIVAQNLAIRGMRREEIELALRENSPELTTRKRGHVDDYVQRTVDRALESDRVLQARARGLERTRTRGRSDDDRER